MLDHARAAMRLASGHARADLATDESLRYALFHLLCITGEVATHVSATTRQLHPDIPWNAARGMRNWLIHGYDVVDLDVVWTTVTSDLPDLVHLLEGILEAE